LHLEDATPLCASSIHRSRFHQQLSALKRNAEPLPEVRQTVQEILAQVRERGDAALLDYTARFGGPKLTAGKLLVTGSVPAVDPQTELAISTAHCQCARLRAEELAQKLERSKCPGSAGGRALRPVPARRHLRTGRDSSAGLDRDHDRDARRRGGCPEIVVATPSDASGKVNDALLLRLALRRRD
jgi:histidinol dehydrogenase